MGDATFTLLGLITMPDPATLTAIGTGVGAAIGALIATLRTNKQTTAIQSETRDIRRELNGPGEEPSLRQMVRDGNQASLDQYAMLHVDLIRLSDRVKQIENGGGNTIIATTLGSIHANIQELTRGMKRCRVNIHNLANAVQVKLITEEEADAIFPKEEESRSQL